jgi:hypothetical protein
MGILKYCAGVLALLASCSLSSEATPIAAISLPTPPEQNSPWTAPERQVPKALDVASTILFSQGLPDPRGCEYRAIKVTIGNVWSGKGQTVETHGWVLPASASSATRYAICWNGLIYKTESVGEPADITRDVAPVIASDQAFAQRDDFHRYASEAFNEDRAVSYTEILPLKACLLLRDGYPDLGSDYWNEWIKGTEFATDHGTSDLYGKVSSDWTWAMFDRAICAHMRSDDVVSLLDCRELTRILPLVRAVIATDHPVKEQRPELRDRTFDQLTALLADEERRVAEPERPHPVQIQITPPELILQGTSDRKNEEPKSDPDRIKALIADLEYVSARQWGQPGGVPISSDPIVQTLIRQGDAAVEPLLDVLINDDRLTRSVSFGRDFFRYRHCIGVSAAAADALEGILQTTFPNDYDVSSPDKRRQLAAAMRTFWLAHRGLTGPELWYNVLADDGETVDHWKNAAAHIVTRSNSWYENPGFAQVTPLNWGSVSSFGSTEPLVGEILRNRTNPSVTELLIKRASADVPAGGDTFALALATWDGGRNLPVLRQYTQQLEHWMTLKTSFNTEYKIPAIASLYLSRMELKDPTAAADYAKWLKTMKPSDCNVELVRLFDPCFASHDPAIDASIRSMFLGPNATWDPFDSKAPANYGGTYWNFTDLVKSPMIGQAVFREFLLKNLANRTDLGTVAFDEHGMRSNQVSNRWPPQIGDPNGDPLAPAPNSRVPYRVCDFLASYIADIEGAPAFEPYWPTAKRDAAVSACADFIRRYGPSMVLDPALRSVFNDAFEPHAHPEFPHLKRPAELSDVKAGRAIFALTGRRRVVNLATYPMKATWVNRNDDATQQLRHSKSANATYQQQHLESGYVWQAEEVWEHGKWTCWYGFVGQNALLMLPASSVTFETPRPRGQGKGTVLF